MHSSLNRTHVAIICIESIHSALHLRKGKQKSIKKETDSILLFGDFLG
jgi:hypothetical protein